MKMRKLILFLCIVLIMVPCVSADVIEVDGLYFNRGDNDVITLTMPLTGVYSGKIHIPYEVNYNGHTYEVSYDFGTVFSNSDIAELSFGEGFTKISTWTTQNCPKLKRLQLPSTIEVDGGHICFWLSENVISAAVKDDGETFRIKAEVFNVYDAFGKKLEPYLLNGYDGTRIYPDENGYWNQKTRPDDRAFTESDCGVFKISSYYAVGFYVDINGHNVLVRTNTPVNKTGDKVIVNGIRYDILGDGSGACVSRDIVDCNYTRDIKIASYVNYNGRTYPVTLIDQYAFMNTDIRSVTLPPTIKSIGCSKITDSGYSYSYSRAFSGCTNLTTVNLNDGLEMIGSDSFYNCKNLQSIKLPETLKKIGYYAFDGCSSLSSINIPESVEDETNQYMSTAGWFKNCTSLEYIEIPDNIWNLGDNMFAGCSNLKTIKLGKGIKSIGSRCFAGCKSLEDFVIPNNVVCDGPFTDNPRYCSFEIVENNDDYIEVKITNNIRYIDYGRQPTIANSDVWLYYYSVNDNQFRPQIEKEYIGYTRDDFPIRINHNKYILVDNSNYIRYGYLSLEVSPNSGISGTLARFDLTPENTSGIEDVVVDNGGLSDDTNGSVSVYDLQGVQRYHGDRDAMPTLPHGIYIIRYSNGKAKKMIL